MVPVGDRLGPELLVEGDDAAHEAEHQRDGVVGDLRGAVVGHVEHRHAARAPAAHVDVVEADARAQHRAHVRIVLDRAVDGAVGREVQDRRRRVRTSAGVGFCSAVVNGCTWSSALPLPALLDAGIRIGLVGEDDEGKVAQDAVPYSMPSLARRKLV
jgi:hypothetical protein